MSIKLKRVVKLFIPPALILVYRKIFVNKIKATDALSINDQNKGTYWGSNAALLETWGEKHVWNEIQIFLYNYKGKVLDIACGTGAVMKKLSRYQNLNIYGIDNSTELIDLCKQKGIENKYLVNHDVINNLPYSDNFFDYSYSIGLLHYIHGDVLDNFIKETRRITNNISFHNFLISKNGKDEDIVHTWQEYINNSAEWWVYKFKQHYEHVEYIYSGWQDNDYNMSDSIWLICFKRNQ